MGEEESEIGGDSVEMPVREQNASSENANDKVDRTQQIEPHASSEDVKENDERQQSEVHADSSTEKEHEHDDECKTLPMGEHATCSKQIKSVSYPLADYCWRSLMICAEGNITWCCDNDVWAYLCIILPFVWYGLRVTQEILKDGFDVALICRFFIYAAGSAYVSLSRNNMFDEFYIERFLNGDRASTIAFNCCCHPDKRKNESTCDTVNREMLSCKEGSMWCECSERFSETWKRRCNRLCGKKGGEQMESEYYKTRATEGTCNGCIIFINVFAFTFMIWASAFHYLEGNCLQDEVCDLKKEGEEFHTLVIVTQIVEIVLMFINVIQGFAVGYQLIQFLYWAKLLLWTLRKMIFHHIKEKEHAFVGIHKKKPDDPEIPNSEKIEWDEERGRKIQLWDVELKEPGDPELDWFWTMVMTQYKRYIWDRLHLGSNGDECYTKKHESLDNITLEKIYNFHQYVSIWLRNAPGEFYFNSIFIVCTIALVTLISILFYSIVSQTHETSVYDYIPLVLGTSLLMFILAKLAAVNTLGEEVVKMYGLLELEIIHRELDIIKEETEYRESMMMTQKPLISHISSSNHHAKHDSTEDEKRSLLPKRDPSLQKAKELVTFPCIDEHCVVDDIHWLLTVGKDKQKLDAVKL